MVYTLVGICLCCETIYLLLPLSCQLPLCSLCTVSPVHSTSFSSAFLTAKWTRAEYIALWFRLDFGTFTSPPHPPLYPCTAKWTSAECIAPWYRPDFRTFVSPPSPPPVIFTLPSEVSRVHPFFSVDDRPKILIYYRYYTLLKVASFLQKGTQWWPVSRSFTVDCVTCSWVQCVVNSRLCSLELCSVCCS